MTNENVAVRFVEIESNTLLTLFDMWEIGDKTSY